jgi:hypothetical protein
MSGFEPVDYKKKTKTRGSNPVCGDEESPQTKPSAETRGWSDPKNVTPLPGEEEAGAADFKAWDESAVGNDQPGTLAGPPPSPETQGLAYDLFYDNYLRDEMEAEFVDPLTEEGYRKGISEPTLPGVTAFALGRAIRIRGTAMQLPLYVQAEDNTFRKVPVEEPQPWAEKMLEVLADPTRSNAERSQLLAGAFAAPGVDLTNDAYQIASGLIAADALDTIGPDGLLVLKRRLDVVAAGGDAEKAGKAAEMSKKLQAELDVQGMAGAAPTGFHAFELGEAIRKQNGDDWTRVMLQVLSDPRRSVAERSQLLAGAFDNSEHGKPRPGDPAPDETVPVWTEGEQIEDAYTITWGLMLDNAFGTVGREGLSALQDLLKKRAKSDQDAVEQLKTVDPAKSVNGVTAEEAAYQYSQRLLMVNTMIQQIQLALDARPLHERPFFAHPAVTEPTLTIVADGKVKDESIDRLEEHLKKLFHETSNGSATGLATALAGAKFVVVPMGEKITDSEVVLKSLTVGMAEDMMAGVCSVDGADPSGAQMPGLVVGLTSGDKKLDNWTRGTLPGDELVIAIHEESLLPHHAWPAEKKQGLPPLLDPYAPFWTFDHELGRILLNRRVPRIDEATAALLPIDDGPLDPTLHPMVARVKRAFEMRQEKGGPFGTEVAAMSFDNWLANAVAMFLSPYEKEPGLSWRDWLKENDPDLFNFVEALLEFTDDADVWDFPEVGAEAPVNAGADVPQSKKPIEGQADVAAGQWTGYLVVG